MQSADLGCCRFIYVHGPWKSSRQTACQTKLEGQTNLLWRPSIPSTACGCTRKYKDACQAIIVCMEAMAKGQLRMQIITGFQSNPMQCMMNAVPTFKSSSWETSSGRSVWNDSKPTSSQFLRLFLTYVSESFLLPTSTTARPGTCQKIRSACAQ